MKETFDLIDFALQKSGLEELKDPTQVQYLGEGAWHQAYLVQLRTGSPVVVRFPKPVAYGKTVEFDEAAIHAEYGGTKAYYELANRVKPGICPEFYYYHVEKDKTFTVESYVGRAFNLEKLTFMEAFQAGAEMGEFFRGMKEIKHGLEGFGYLRWTGENLQGQLQSDVTDFMKEENEEYISDLKTCLDEFPNMIHPELLHKLEACMQDRTINNEQIVLTNQDTSPENILIHMNGSISLIDPLPILYSADGLAGNFLNNYRTLFPTFYNAPRYAKHQFNRYTDRLQSIAEGFLQGYCDGDLKVKRRVLQEEFIKLSDLTVTHFQLSKQDELSEEQRIRYGEKEAIQNRIPEYIRRLEAFQWNVEDDGSKLA